MSETTSKRRFLRRLRLNRVDLVGAGANPGAHVALHKAQQPRTNETGGTIEGMSENAAATDPVEPEAVAPSEPEATEPETVTPVEPVAEPVAASRDNENIGKADHQALAKKLEDAQAEIAKMRDEQERRDYTEIAKSELGALPEKPETTGDILRKAKRALEDSEYQTLFRLLKAANAQVDTSALFKQFADGNDSDPKSVEEQVAEKARALVDAGSAKTVEQATVQVLAASPELRKAYGARQGN